MITRALFAIVLVYGLGACESGKTEASNTQSAGCKAGQDGCLPDVKFVDTTGKAYTAQQLAGKVVIVNFWATWCHPCQKEIPDLSKLYEKYKKDVVMLGVLSDSPTDNDLLNFQSDYAMTYPVVRSSSDILVSFHYPQALPTTFIYDKSGRQVGTPRVGAIRPDDLDKQLAALIAQK